MLRLMLVRKAARLCRIWDFTERVDPQVVNKRALAAPLVRGGALDSTGASRLTSSTRRSPGQRARRAQQGPGVDLRPRPNRPGRATTPPHRPPSTSGTSCGSLRRRPWPVGQRASARRPRRRLRARPIGRWQSSNAAAMGAVVCFVGGIVSAVKALTDQEGCTRWCSSGSTISPGSTEAVVFTRVNAASRDLC